MRISTLAVLFLLLLAHSAFPAITPASLPDGLVGLIYPTASQPPGVKFQSDLVTPGERRVSWTAKGIPRGMTFNSLGVLSGKPAVPGNYTLAVQVRVGGGLRDSGTVGFSINATEAPTINAVVLPAARFDSPYKDDKTNNGFQLTARGGIPFTPNSVHPTGYNWTPLPGRLPSQRLPQGMTLSPRGVISGTPVWPKPPVPSTPQTYIIQVRATDFVGKSATANFTLVVAPPEGPEIITECPLPSGLEKDRYPVVELKARKGKPSYRWPKPINLPPGLVWNERGYISGTPSVYGNFTIDLRVIDANGLTANKTCLIEIRPAPEIGCPHIPCARVGDTLLPVRLAARGGDLPYRFSAVDLPPGLSINATTGIISGNFTGGGDLTHEPTFTVSDAANRTANITCPIVVKERLEITTASPLPFGIRGLPYPGKTGVPVVSINAIGGWPPYTYQRVLGLLPDGLSINPNTGVISGTPTKTGTFKFTIRVKDSCEPPAGWVDKEFEIPIYDPITVFPQPSPCLTVNRTFSLNLTASGGALPYVWSNFTASSENYNLSVPDPNNTRTVRVDGTPSQAGPVFFTFDVTSLDITETFTVNYTVHPELKITSDCPPSGWTRGKSLNPINLIATGGSGNYIWSKYDTANKPWPAGIDIVGSKIQGTPSLTSNATTFSIAYRVVDSCGNADIKECEISVFFECECELETSESGGGLAIALDTSGSTYSQDVTVNGVQNQTRRFAFLQILTDYNLTSNPNRFDEPGSSVSNLDSMISRSITALGANTNYLRIVILNDSQDPGTPSWSNTQQAYSSVANNSLKIAVYYIRIAGVVPNPTIQQQLVDFINMKPAFVDQFYQNSFTAYNTGDAGELNDILDDIFTSQYRCTDKFGNDVIISSADANSIEEAKNIVCSQNPTPTLFQIINTPELESNAEFLNVSIEKNIFSIENEILINTYNFKISKNEISISEYAEFLNSIANDDAHSVYNSLMSNIGLSKNSGSGSASFFVDPDFADHPIAYVSWFDAARYANWLANGKPLGAQDSTTTEDGTYNLSSGTIVRNSINPNTGEAPTCWLLNESEWYTSAYLRSDASSLWTYPTQSNTAPDSSGAYPSNFANFGGVFGETTPVGFFDQCPGPFGTFDQAGNVREWTETLDTSSGTPMRIIRGGSWADPADAMRADESHVADPTLEDDKTGFRIGGAP